LEGFAVTLKTFLGLAKDNQCCQAIVNEDLGQKLHGTLAVWPAMPHKRGQQL